MTWRGWWHDHPADLKTLFLRPSKMICYFGALSKKEIFYWTWVFFPHLMLQILSLTLRYLFCWLVAPVFHSSIFSSWFYFFPTLNRRAWYLSFVFWDLLTSLYKNWDITTVLTVSEPELPCNVMVKQHKVKTNLQKNPASLDEIIGVQEREQVQATDTDTLQGGMGCWQYGNTQEHIRIHDKDVQKSWKLSQVEDCFFDKGFCQLFMICCCPWKGVVFFWTYA